jgi:ketosteroid isomerase-like protein
MKYIFSILSYTCLLHAWCFTTGNAQTALTSDLSSVKQSIQQLNEKYFTAIKQHDVKAFEAQFLEDSWIMVPNTAVYCGPGALASYFHETLLKQGIAKGRFITIDLYGIGTDVMAEVGFYQFFNEQNEQFDDGKFMVLWKNADGQWKRLRQTLVTSRSMR